MKLPNLTVGVSSPGLRRERNPSEAKPLRLPVGLRPEYSRRGINYFGMTIPELLVSLAIIAILILIGLWFYRKQIFRGNDARRKGDIHNLQEALEEYEKDNECYPLPQVIDCSPGDGLNPYLPKVPCDPVTKSSYYYDYDTTTTCPKWYRLYANLDTESYGSFGPDGAFNFSLGSSNAPPAGFTLSAYYGCRARACVPILWDSGRPGPECDPNFQNQTCYGQCASQGNECQDWDQ